MVSFLSAAARSMGLEVATYQLAAGKPILVLTWRGLEPGLASVLLNSHMDVVPVFPEHWTHPPFAAHKVRYVNTFSVLLTSGSIFCKVAIGVLSLHKKYLWLLTAL